MSAASGKEAAAVEAVLDLYVNSVFNGEAETLSGLFHPAAVMYGYLGDKLLLGGPQPFLDDIGGRPPMAVTAPHFKAVFSDVHVSGRAATATLHEEGFFGTGRFVNYFHLLKIDGTWKIVSKTFESL